MTTASSTSEIKGYFGLVEQLEGTLDVIENDNVKARERLQIGIEQALSMVPPVPVRVAAELLQLTEPTVRNWLREGVLSPAEQKTSTVTQLDPVRLHTVGHLVATLREQGVSRGDLMDKVWWRLTDESIVEREDLQQSLAQLREGDLVDL